jgi:hypothetical protein
VVKCQKLKEQIEEPDKKSVIEKLEVKGEGELDTKVIISILETYFSKRNF